MGLLKNEYKSFLDDIEKNIKNKEDLDYIKERFVSFMDIVLNEMDRIMEYKEEKMEQLENTQKQLGERMSKMQQIIENIEKDIYAEEGFDFEIVCPYCNYEFVIDLDENKTEIECPECNNMIELDWTGDLEEEQEHCQGSCHSCSGCGNDDQNIKENEEQYYDDENNEDTEFINNDEDM